MDGLAAHMSNKACTEVFGVACLLPALLQSQMIPRLDVWPKSFNSSAPTDNVVDLYIFPENERCCFSTFSCVPVFFPHMCSFLDFC